MAFALPMLLKASGTLEPQAAKTYGRPMRSSVRRLHISVSALGLATVIAGRAHAGPIENLAPGEWYEVPNSHMSSVDPCPANNCSYSGSTGQDSVMGSWGGGGYDIVRDRLIVWGGGHGNYGGNEVYAFDLNSFAWSRLSNPSDPPTADQPYAADGQPTSRHTYDYVQYVPMLDAFCSLGGATFYLNGQTGTKHTDCFSFASNAWFTRADTAALGGFIAAFSAVDSGTGHVFHHGSGLYSTLAEYVPTTDTWISHGSQFTENAYTYSYVTAAVDPIRHVFVAVGSGFAAAWDLTKTGEYSGTPVSTQGPQDVVQTPGPGFAYDNQSQQLVGWAGGTHVYSLDPSSWTWTDHPPAASNTVTPTAPSPQGTFGRFAYSQSKNVFVVVNSKNENVFVYRLSAGAGQPYDGGVVSLGDAGATPSDGGTLGDAGATPSDGGPQTDAGAEVDGGGPVPPGRGGCSCDGVGGSGAARGGYLLEMLFGLGVYLARYRQRHVTRCAPCGAATCPPARRR